jgi:hypothetical protein
LSLARLLGAYRKSRELRKAERRDLVRALWAILGARISLRLTRRGALLEAGGSSPRTGVAAPGELDRAREIAVAVRRVAQHGPIRASCLARALATRRLLAREGMHDATIRVGVLVREGQFRAHAWVELAGVHLVESDAELEDLAEVPELRLVGGR